MSESLETARAFFDAVNAKDWGRLGGLLAEGFTFRGSLARFDTPEAFLEGMRAMPFDGSAESSGFIVDGSHVAHRFVWKMTAPTRVDVPMCEVLRVDGGKVASSELYYDSAHFPRPA